MNNKHNKIQFTNIRSLVKSDDAMQLKKSNKMNNTYFYM